MGTKKEKIKKEIFETCIKCGTLTTVKKTDNVTHRHYYIEGAGQLCFKCGQRDKREVEHAQKLWNSIID